MLTLSAGHLLGARDVRDPDNPSPGHEQGHPGSPGHWQCGDPTPARSGGGKGGGTDRWSSVYTGTPVSTERAMWLSGLPTGCSLPGRGLFPNPSTPPDREGLPDIPPIVESGAGIPTPERDSTPSWEDRPTGPHGSQRPRGSRRRRNRGLKRMDPHHRALRSARKGGPPGPECRELPQTPRTPSRRLNRTSHPRSADSDFFPPGGEGSTRPGQFAGAQLRDDALKHAWSHVPYRTHTIAQGGGCSTGWWKKREW